MNLVYGYDEAIAAWVAERIPHVGLSGFGPCSAIGVATGDKLIAAMVYHDYQESVVSRRAHKTIQLSMASESHVWAKPEVIRGLLFYPFEQLGVWLAWTATPIDNTRALTVNKKVGFKKEAILADRFGIGRHAVICRMKRKDYLRIFGLI